MIDINELRQKLYKKYKRIELAKELKKSPVQISRILNGKSKMNIDDYNTLFWMIK